MNLFSWLYLISFILAYLASVGWTMFNRDSQLLTEAGTYGDYTTSDIWFFGPMFHLKELFSNIVEYTVEGFKLLFSKSYREEKAIMTYADEEDLDD